MRVEDFDLLAMDGGLEGLERTELLDGDIHLLGPQYVPHGMAKAVFHDALLEWKRVYRPELSLFTAASVAMPPHASRCRILCYVTGNGVSWASQLKPSTC